MQEAERLAEEKGWSVAPDGESYRRVVPSPLPRDIVEWRAIETLLQVGRAGACHSPGGAPEGRRPRAGRGEGGQTISTSWSVATGKLVPLQAMP